VLGFEFQVSVFNARASILSERRFSKRKAREPDTQHLKLETRNFFRYNRSTTDHRSINVQRIIALLIMTLVLSPVSSFAQTRKRTTKSGRTSAAPKASEAQRAGAARVADQIKILTRFIYLLGGVAKGLEGVDDATRRNEASPAIIDQAKQSKATVRASIQSVREGLDKLEIDFRSTPELQRYYIKLAGVASGAANAEELAAGNQFDKAGRTLLEVVNHLTDVLLEMR
jgi:hypothetical protein